MKIGIIAYRHCTASMVIGMADILSLANTQGTNKKKPLFEVVILTEDGKPVTSFTGYQMIPDSSFRTKTKFDIVYVPGFLADPLEIISAEQKTVAWLQRQH